MPSFLTDGSITACVT